MFELSSIHKPKPIGLERPAGRSFVCVVSAAAILCKSLEESCGSSLEQFWLCIPRCMKRFPAPRIRTFFFQSTCCLGCGHPFHMSSSLSHEFLVMRYCKLFVSSVDWSLAFCMLVVLHTRVVSVYVCFLLCVHCIARPPQSDHAQHPQTWYFCSFSCAKSCLHSLYCSSAAILYNRSLISSLL